MQVKAFGKRDEATIAGKTIMRHALILGDDHRIAHIIIAEIGVKRVGARFFDQAFHALAEFTVRVRVVTLDEVLSD